MSVVCVVLVVMLMFVVEMVVSCSGIKDDDGELGQASFETVATSLPSSLHNTSRIVSMLQFKTHTVRYAWTPG